MYSVFFRLNYAMNKRQNDNLPFCQQQTPSSFRVQGYGMTHHKDLFTNRQLTALTTFSGLVAEAQRQAQAHEAEAVLGKAGVVSLSVVIGVTGWTGMAKVVRAEVRRPAPWGRSRTRRRGPEPPTG